MKLKKKNIFISILVLLIIAVVVIEIGTYKGIFFNDEEGEPLVLLGSEFPSNRFFVLAQEKGFFEEEGVNAIVKDVPDAQAVQAFVAGELDFLHVSPDWYFILKDQGVEATQILFFERAISAEGLAVDKDINLLEDLKDKKIAAWEGTLLHFQLLVMLEKEGLTTDNIEIISLSPDQAMTAFISGDVDAAAAYEPWLSQYVEREDAKLLYVDKDLPMWTMSSLVVSDEALKNRRKDVKAVMRGYFKAVDYWKNNKQEANEIMGASIGISGDDFQYFMDKTNMLDYDECLQLTKDGTSNLIIDKANEIWLKEGIISKPLTREEAFDTSLLEELYS